MLCSFVLFTAMQDFIYEHGCKIDWGDDSITYDLGGVTFVVFDWEIYAQLNDPKQTTICFKNTYQ